MKENFEQKSILPFTGEYIKDGEGRLCPVLDTLSISTENAQLGRKKGTTLVRRAKEGEIPSQQFSEGKEASNDYVCKEGDAIFVNSPTDQYVPSRGGTQRLKFDDLEEAGYSIASTDGLKAQVHSPQALLLVSIVDTRICIKGAWGDPSNPENNQFLSNGATLKIQDAGRITGMDREGFGKWELIHQSNKKQLLNKP